MSVGAKSGNIWGDGTRAANFFNFVGIAAPAVVE